MSQRRIRIPTHEELSEGAVKALMDRGFSERTILRLVPVNYPPLTKSEVEDIIKRLKRDKAKEIVSLVRKYYNPNRTKMSELQDLLKRLNGKNGDKENDAETG